MEGKLGRCRGILGALFPSYYWFRLDAATFTLSYAVNQESIDEPLMEIDLTLAKVHQKSTKICIETFLEGLFTLKASSEAEASAWATKIENAIQQKEDLLRVPDGEEADEMFVESSEAENSSDYIPLENPQYSSNPQESSSNPQESSNNPQKSSSNPQESSSNPQESSSNPQESFSNLQESSSNPQESSDSQGIISNPPISREKSEKIKRMAKLRHSYSLNGKMERMVQEIDKSASNQRVSSEVSTPANRPKISQYVVAIDFGTTFSGYAYQHCSDHATNPASGCTETWKGNKGLSEKTPTSLLLEKDGTFKAFGYEAEQYYSDLMENGEEKGWRFFKQFKMNIFQRNDLSRNFEIKDDQGSSMPAGDVFGISIEFLKQCAFKKIKKGDPNMMEENIFYVITVPAIWCENSRQFMLDAIKRAGIDNDQAILAKEPEAAAVYCKEKQLEVQRANKRIDAQGDVFEFDVGSKFIVLDLGGGTADVAVHEVINNGRMKLLRSASGGPWGGCKPNEEFMSLIKEILGKDKCPYEEFLKGNRGECYELLQDWELQKRIRDGSTDLSFSLPRGMKLPDELGDISTSKGRARISSGGKLKIYAETLKLLFDETVKKIVDHLEKMSSERAFDDINVMFMVGGFSDSKFIQDAVRERFPDMTIIVPKSPGLAVLYGAVTYGFQPNTIDARISSCHYGIEENGRFILLINKGQEIPIGVIVSSYSTKLVSEKDGFHIKIFASDEKYPPKEIEKCRKLGEIFIRMTRTYSKMERQINIAIYFDHTEMKVQATDVLTNIIFKTSCNFLV